MFSQLPPQKQLLYSFADQCNRDNWIINILTGVKRSNLIEQLDIPDVDIQYLRDLVNCPEDSDLSKYLPDDLLAFRIDEPTPAATLPIVFTRSGIEGKAVSGLAGGVVGAAISQTANTT